MTRVKTVLPRSLLEHLCRALRTSHRVIAEDIAYSRRQPGSSRIAHRTAQLAELTSLLDQLSRPPDEDVEVTGEFEPLRAATCEAVIILSERLAELVHSHWNYGANLRRTERQLAVVQEGAALLGKLDAAKSAAASQPPTTM
jgi:hypothetical protein